MTEQGPQSSGLPSSLLLLFSSTSGASHISSSPRAGALRAVTGPAELQGSRARWHSQVSTNLTPGIPKEESRELTDELGDSDAPISQEVPPPVPTQGGSFETPQSAQSPSLPPATAQDGSSPQSGLASGFSRLRTGPVPSPGSVLSRTAASGHLACSPGCSGCSNQMRLACPLKQVPTRCHPRPRTASCCGEPPTARRAQPGPATSPRSKPQGQGGQWEEEEGSRPAGEIPFPQRTHPESAGGGAGRGRRRGRPTGLRLLPGFLTLADSPAPDLGGAPRPLALPGIPGDQPSWDSLHPCCSGHGHQARRSAPALGFPVTLLAREGEQLGPSAPVQPSGSSQGPMKELGEIFSKSEFPARPPER